MIQPIKKLRRNIFGPHPWIGLFLVVLGISGCAGSPQSPQDEPLTPPVNTDPLVAQLILEGNQFFTRQRFRDAVTKYEAAIKVQSTSGEAHYNLGLALFKRSLHSEARPHFEKAAELEPFNLVIRNAPPFRKYETIVPNTPQPAPDGHFGHQH